MDHTPSKTEGHASRRKTHLKLVSSNDAPETTVGEVTGQRRTATSTIGRLIAQTAMLADSTRSGHDRTDSEESEQRIAAPARRPRSARFGWFI